MRCSTFATQLILTFSSSIACLGAAQAAMPSKLELESISEIKAAYEEANFNKFSELSRNIPRDSLFSPYIDTWLFRLIQDPQGTSDDTEFTIWRSKEIIPILSRHENTWAAESLRRDWLEQLARTEQWALFKEQRDLLRYRPDLGVECADMLFSAYQGQYVRSKVMELISYERRLPRTCRVVLRKLYDRRVVSAEDLNLRVFNLVANNHLTNTQKFIDEFNDTGWGKSVPQSVLKKATFDPERYLKDVKKGKDISNISITSALIRIAVKDVDSAIGNLNSYYRKYLSEHSEAWLWGHIGYRSALEWNPRSTSYFDKSQQALLGPDYREWSIRAALLNNDLIKASSLIDELPENLKKEETWQYWKARGLALQGKTMEARQVWASIGQPFSFYGKLSLEELGNSVAPPIRPRTPTAAELEIAKSNPGLQRSLAFYDADMRYEGFREFNLQSEQMNDRELLAAATWAKNNQLYDRAIAAADRTTAEHDVSLRYLTPFQENMFSKTNEVGIDPAWVYGVIRQESRFVSIARSHVGANGLMQVMPATARYVARKIGLKDFKLSEVNQIDTNLILGTSYLKIVSEGLDNSPVMASAGYNAGPSRPRTWRKRLGSNRSIEGALFAELIPFDETRHYVKNVMSNTVVYSQLLSNNTVPLKERLGIIHGTD